MSEQNAIEAPITPSAATPAEPAPAAIQQTSAQPATPATPQAPATGAQATGPEGWVPSYRLREAGEAAFRRAQTESQAEIARIKQEAEQYKRQLHSLVGVSQPADPQVDAVRQQFAQLYPGLSKMEDRAAQLEQLLERAGDLESQTNHYWQSYGRQAMDRLFTHAATSLGTPLTDEGKRALHASFTGFVQSSPELTERYANDPTLVEDFWKAFSSSFIDPVRRTASAGVVGRAAGSMALPQDAPSGAPRVGPAPQPQNLDERAANAWVQYQQQNTRT